MQVHESKVAVHSFVQVQMREIVVPEQFSILMCVYMIDVSATSLLKLLSSLVWFSLVYFQQ